MKLTYLSIENFRALSSITLAQLKDMVVIAGPNGCGKSCVLEAIKLLKASYGSYEQDEFTRWFSELQIDPKRAAMLPIFHDRSKPMRIQATFDLSEAERLFLRSSSEELLIDMIWKEKNAERFLGMRSGYLNVISTQKANRSDVTQRAKKELPDLKAKIETSTLNAAVTISPDGRVDGTKNILLDLIFSIYEPQKLGIVDFHGPNRIYSRETVGNVNLTIESTAQRTRQQALFDHANKYSNLKSEMASSYIRHLLAKESDPSLKDDDSLTETLKELFATFFPGKSFDGPRPTPDGRLRFTVRVPGGEHDIDDLSSGEKEVLYGYLRLHNSAPRNSIILVDEPELHLNPRLVGGLASFYHRHLSQKLGNQLWLVTHSDTLMREAVAQPNFSVFHIHPAHTSPDGQATPVAGAEEVERLVIELIGDLAAYRPGAKIVIFESTEASSFDKEMTCQLFPEFERAVNAISGGAKRRVSDLYDVLEQARRSDAFPGQFFAIIDGDDEEDSWEGSPATRLRWDVYHIENYLLEPKFVLHVLSEMHGAKNALTTEQAVEQELHDCAAATMHHLIHHKLETHANRTLISCVDLGCDPNRTDVAKAVGEAVRRSGRKVIQRIRSELNSSKLKDYERKISKEYADALNGPDWKKRFRGREILRKFAGKHAKGTPYEVFRNLIIAQMKRSEHKPRGMETVINSILDA